MREFFDTSVFVAAFWGGHVHHQASLRLVSAARKSQSACALHTLAEVYATMTALPVRDVIPPAQALLFIEEIRDRCTLVGLDEEDYRHAIDQAAARGFVSGRIYDGLLLRCAAKIRARTIYTWNLKHFQSIDPGQASKIRTPRAIA